MDGGVGVGVTLSMRSAASQCRIPMMEARIGHTIAFNGSLLTRSYNKHAQTAEPYTACTYTFVAFVRMNSPAFFFFSLAGGALAAASA